MLPCESVLHVQAQNMLGGQMAGRGEGTKLGWVQTGRAKDCVGGDTNKRKVWPCLPCHPLCDHKEFFVSSASSSVKWGCHEERRQCMVATSSALETLYLS